MRIKWTVGGLEVPNIGIAVVDGIVDVNEDTAMSLIAQGLAVSVAVATAPVKQVRPAAITTKEEGGA